MPKKNKKSVNIYSKQINKNNKSINPEIRENILYLDAKNKSAVKITPSTI